MINDERMITPKPRSGTTRESLFLPREFSDLKSCVTEQLLLVGGASSRSTLKEASKGKGEGSAASNSENRFVFSDGLAHVISELRDSQEWRVYTKWHHVAHVRGGLILDDGALGLGRTSANRRRGVACGWMIYWFAEWAQSAVRRRPILPVTALCNYKYAHELVLCFPLISQSFFQSTVNSPEPPKTTAMDAQNK